MIKGIVFDLDHTLFDRYKTLMLVSPYICESLKEYLAEGVTPDIFGKNLCMADKMYVIYGWNEILNELDRAGMFKKKPDFEVYRKAVIQSYLHDAVPYDFVNSMLETLRDAGYKTGLITNGFRDIQQAKIDLLGIEKLFDKIIICGDIGVQKPDTKPFLKMADMLDCKPSELVYVGDNPFNDCVGARNAGYTPVWVKTTNIWPEEIEPCQLSVETVEEIPALVRKIMK